MMCQVCRRIVAEVRRYCPYCGSRMNEVVKWEVVAYEARHSDRYRMECDACALLNAGDARFCSRCGSDKLHRVPLVITSVW